MYCWSSWCLHFLCVCVFVHVCSCCVCWWVMLYVYITSWLCLCLCECFYVYLHVWINSIWIKRPNRAYDNSKRAEAHIQCTHMERLSFRRNDAHRQSHVLCEHMVSHPSHSHMCHMLCNGSVASVTLKWHVTYNHVRGFNICISYHMLLSFLLILYRKWLFYQLKKSKLPTVIHLLKAILQKKPNPLLSALLHWSLLNLIVLIHLPDVKTGN